MPVEPPPSPANVFDGVLSEVPVADEPLAVDAIVLIVVVLTLVGFCAPHG